MAYTPLNNINVSFDDKKYGNVIDPLEWNQNFKEIENNINTNNIILNLLLGDVSDADLTAIKALLESHTQQLDDRYTKDVVDSKLASETSGLISSFNVDVNTGIITVTKKDGTTEKYDTALEKVPAKFELVENGGNYFLRITNVDGSFTQVNITTLMNIYQFNNGNEISFSVTGSGNTKEVTSTIRDGSIRLSKLNDEVIQRFSGSAEAAQASANSAKASADSAKDSVVAATTQANLAKGYAESAKKSADSAMTSANSANAASQSVSENANVARTSANTASAASTEATKQAGIAKEHKESAANSVVEITNLIAGLDDKVATVNTQAENITAIETHIETLDTQVTTNATNAATSETNAAASAASAAESARQAAASAGGDFVTPEELEEALATMPLVGREVVEGLNVGEIFNNYENNKAIGNYSHAEGYDTTASGDFSHAEGYNTTASGSFSHTEGEGATASGNYSHAEGCSATASGSYSHAEGYGTSAQSLYSHAEGEKTIAASANQHVQGKWNVKDSNDTYAFIIGNGEDIAHRSNALAVKWNGEVVVDNNKQLYGEHNKELLSGQEIAFPIPDGFVVGVNNHSYHKNIDGDVVVNICICKTGGWSGTEAYTLFATLPLGFRPSKNTHSVAIISDGTNISGIAVLRVYPDGRLLISKVVGLGAGATTWCVGNIVFKAAQ